MSNTVKRKITVQLPKPRELSLNRLSVFQRLGNHKSKLLLNQSIAANIQVTAILEEKPSEINVEVDAAKTEASLSSNKPSHSYNSNVVERSNFSGPDTLPSGSLKMKHHSSTKLDRVSSVGGHHHHRLEDADPDLLEQKRAELKKELELQMKMDSARSKPGASSKSGADGSMRKRKPAHRSSSSSSSSSSGSDSSSDSSSSDSVKGGRRKVRKNAKTKRHQSSSSSEEDPRRKKAAAIGASSAISGSKSKRVCHKKLETLGGSISGKIKQTHHSKKSALDAKHTTGGGGHQQQRKRSPSPSAMGMVRKHQRPISPKSGGLKSSTAKAYAADQASSSSLKHHHRVKETTQLVQSQSSNTGREREKEREFQMRERERERDREREHLRGARGERRTSRTPPGKVRIKSRSPMKQRTSRSRDIKQRSPPPPLMRRASSKVRGSGAPPGGGVGVRRDRTPERIIIKKDVSGSGGNKRHESSREHERRDRDREREAIAREKERQELIRAQEQRVRERERLERDRPRAKVISDHRVAPPIDTRDRDLERSKSDRLLPRPAERAMALAAARDRSRDKSEERLLADMHHRPRSHSHSRTGRGERGGDRDRGADRGGIIVDRGMIDPYAERERYERDERDRYDHHQHRRPEKEEVGGHRGSLVRDDRSDRGGDREREREYMMVRRGGREDSRGRLIEEGMHVDPYLPREKRSALSERDRSIERERALYAAERDRERGHGHGADHGRYEEHLIRGGAVDERRLERETDRGHDYPVPPLRGGAYIDDRPPMRSVDSHHRDRERGGDWHRGDEPLRGDERGGPAHMYDRHSTRDWDRNDQPPSGGNNVLSGRGVGGVGGLDNYPMDSRRDSDWGLHGDRAWDGRGGIIDRGGRLERGVAWPLNEPETENWDVQDDYIPDYHRAGAEKLHHDVEPVAHMLAHGSRGVGGNHLGVNTNRRWLNWRGGGRGGVVGRGGISGGPGNQMHHIGRSLHDEPPMPFRRQNQMHLNAGPGGVPDNFQDMPSDQQYRRHHPSTIGPASGHHDSHSHGTGPDFPPSGGGHHGHPSNAFSNPVVRPLLSLPPIKPPIMDDIMVGPTVGLSPLPKMAHLLGAVAHPPMQSNQSSVHTVAEVTSVIPAPGAAAAAVVDEKIVAGDVVADKFGNNSKETAVLAKKQPCGEDGGDIEEDALSEISDDADEILNQQEEEAAAAAAIAASTSSLLTTSAPLKPALLPTPPFKVGEFPRLLVPASSPYAPQSTPAVVATAESKSTTSSTDPAAHDPNNKDDDIDLDFEEISDGELEEEARIRGLGDALGVDWASLVEESKAIARERNEQRADSASAKQRWQPHRILIDVGVSFRMAGKEFASNVLNAAHRKLKQQEADAKQAEAEAAKQAAAAAAAAAAAKSSDGSTANTMSIKKEVSDEEESSSTTGVASLSMMTSAEQQDLHAKQMADESIEPEAELLIHPIACVQVASRVNAETRKNLVFGATGPFSRALCARRDIEMRRQLCGLSAKRCSSGGDQNTADDAKPNEYATLARQLFEKALGKVN